MLQEKENTLGLRAYLTTETAGHLSSQSLLAQTGSKIPLIVTYFSTKCTANNMLFR